MERSEELSADPSPAQPLIGTYPHSAKKARAWVLPSVLYPVFEYNVRPTGGGLHGADRNPRGRTGDAPAIAEIHLTARREAMPYLHRPHTDDDERAYFARVVGDRPSAWWVANFHQKFSLFAEQWQPKVIAEMNNYQGVVRVTG